MTSNEIFSRIAPETRAALFEWLMEHDRTAYKAAIGLLASRRKLRPVFVERKPRDERHAWMGEALTKPAAADLATELLQAWVLGEHKAMVCGFLDALGISHDGQGILENLPPEPAPALVEAAVGKIRAAYPADAVFVYLQLFAAMDIADWPHLKSLLADDPCHTSTP